MTSIFMGYRSPLSKTFTIKAPAIFQTSSNSGGALSISPPNIKVIYAMI